VTVAQEARFESEAQLHRAIAEHPEVLPSEEFGLGPVVALANELDFGGGPMDLLVADSLGRLAIVEFKRGTENPDVRQVVAQILEYGATLWRHDYDALEELCRRCPPGFPGALTEYVSTAWLHLVSHSMRMHFGMASRPASRQGPLSLCTVGGISTIAPAAS
jgi:hypothetical protein